MPPDFSGQLLYRGGIWQILNYLREPGDILPWDSEQAAERPRVVLSNKYGRLPEEGGGHPQTV